MSREHISLRVNGADRPVASVAPWTTLLTVLRDDLRLTGAKRGCNQGVCGACTVMIDGEPVRSCLSLALNCTDRDIVTVEGLAPTGFADAGPAGAGRRQCRPVRLLHAGHADRRACPVAAQYAADGR